MTLTADVAERTVSRIAQVVNNLDEPDEQSDSNLGIIANVYSRIDELVESGNLSVTEQVSLLR